MNASAIYERDLLASAWRYDRDALSEVVDTMVSTKFGNLDRYKDFVSQEILDAFRKCAGQVEAKILISLVVRFRQCPRGLAPAMAKGIGNPCDDKYERALDASKQIKRSRCYRQTGIIDSNLHRGVIAAAKRIAQRPYYQNWDALEDAVTTAMKVCCRGTKREHFASRQVVADLCKVRGFVGGFTRDNRPSMSKLGVGAVAGFFHAERAKGVPKKHIKFPEQINYLKQTGLCEYPALVITSVDP